MEGYEYRDPPGGLGPSHAHAHASNGGGNAQPPHPSFDVAPQRLGIIPRAVHQLFQNVRSMIFTTNTLELSCFHRS